jgi:malate dehydrogenase (oxaloacetate-decarboxylating)
MSDEKTGHARLFDALTTKGAAFTHPERRKLGLLGLLPTAEQTLAQQAEHVVVTTRCCTLPPAGRADRAGCWHEFSTRPEDLDKHIYLHALQDRNETLFYRVLRDHIPETMPIV